MKLAVPTIFDLGCLTKKQCLVRMPLHVLGVYKQFRQREISPLNFSNGLIQTDPINQYFTKKQDERKAPKSMHSFLFPTTLIIAQHPKFIL